jgi:hypothetical protein|tara:strand:+ start:675 stop:1256 length:582 start_codon:yes stop_codon:yes gene_type:complete
MDDALLKDFIYHKNIIPKQVCKDIIDSTTEDTWEPHAWYSVEDDDTKSHDEKELDVLFPSKETSQKLFKYVIEAFQDYGHFCIDKNYPEEAFGSLIHNCCPPRLNRYNTGTLMRPHFDHIHSLFDGQQKGIPVLSLIGVLNDDYTGGELTFFKDYKLKTRAGDIIIFPSNFLYPHGVQEVKEGSRYSLVSWGW